MADYKLTRLPDHKGQIQYRIETIDEWNDIRLSWNYEKIAERLEVGEEHIISI